MKPREKLYFVFVNRTYDGPYRAAELCKLPNFSTKTLVCLEGEGEWQSACEFPEVDRCLRQLLSGDYNPKTLDGTPASPEAAPTDVAENRPGREWRQAVIGENMPEFKSHLKYSAPSSPVDIPNSQDPPDKLGRHRRELLLALLGFCSIGAFYPESGAMADYVAGLRPADTAPVAMGRRFYQGGSPHHGALKKHAVVHPSKVGSPPTRTVEEIASDDLGNGWVMITEVITEIHNGTPIQHTRTVTVQKKRQRGRSSKTR